MNAFHQGQKVRIKPDAFHNSKHPDDLNALGQIGELTAVIETFDNGQTLWEWHNVALFSHVTYPLTLELEAIE